jgi:hypothetical protein
LNEFPKAAGCEKIRDVFSRAKIVLVAESANGQLDQLFKYAAYGLTTGMVPLFKSGMGIKTMLEN